MSNLTRPELGLLLEQHGDGFHQYVKACSVCGRLYLFYSNRTNCPESKCEGNLLPVSKYVESSRRIRLDNDLVSFRKRD